MHNNSTYTIRIQTKHREMDIGVPVKCNMMCFELVDCNVCSLFPARTCLDSTYFMLSIADYMLFKFIWLFQNTNAKTWTSPYPIFQATVHKLGHKIKLF